MSQNNPSPNTPDRRTVLQAIGSITATGTLIGKTSATSSRSNDQIDYQELGSKSKALFSKLVAGKEIQKKGSELPIDLLVYDRVRYQQSVYRIQREYSKEAVYHLTFDETSQEEVAQRLNNLIGTQADSPKQFINSRGKITRNNLSTTAQNALSTEGDRTMVEELPTELTDNDYLEANGTLYRILAGHGDVPAVTFSIAGEQ